MDKLEIDLAALGKEHWSEQERENVALIADFVQQLMNEHDFDSVLERFDGSAYTQHNRGIPEGFPALVDYVRDFSKRYPDYGYDVKHIHADGDIVCFHSHATIKKAHRGDDRKGLNIMDTWRVRDGVIHEHWDAIQPIDAFMRFYVWMTGGRIRNGNGVF